MGETGKGALPRMAAVVVAIAALVACVVAGAIAWRATCGDGTDGIDVAGQQPQAGQVAQQQGAQGDQPQGTSSTVTGVGGSQAGGASQGGGRTGFRGSSITAQDVPSASAGEGRSTDEVRDAIVRHIQGGYGDATIREIRMMGAGSGASQWEPDTIDTWSTYLVTLGDGSEVGLMVTCSPTTAPYVTETTYLLCGPTLLYDLNVGRYRPIVTDGGQQPYEGQPADGGDAEWQPYEGGE